LYGGFPQVIEAPTQPEKQKEITEQYQTVFYRDLVERHTIMDSYVLELLMKYVVDMYTFILAASKFSTYVKTL
jgi:predicted AAA+ superfamily ATPase